MKQKILLISLMFVLISCANSNLKQPQDKPFPINVERTQDEV